MTTTTTTAAPHCADCARDPYRSRRLVAVADLIEPLLDHLAGTVGLEAVPA